MGCLPCIEKGEPVYHKESCQMNMALVSVNFIMLIGLNLEDAAVSNTTCISQYTILYD